MLDSLDLGIADLGEGVGMGLTSASVRARAVLKAASAEELLGTGQLWGNFNSVDDAVISGLRDVYSVAPIVFRGAANVPPGDSMGFPGAANSGELKYEDFCAGRSKGRAIEIEGSIELGFS